MPDISTCKSYNKPRDDAAETEEFCLASASMMSLRSPVASGEVFHCKMIVVLTQRDDLTRDWPGTKHLRLVLRLQTPEWREKTTRPEEWVKGHTDDKFWLC